MNYIGPKRTYWFMNHIWMESGIQIFRILNGFCYTARYPVRPLYWMGVKSSKLISTFDTFLLVLDELQLSATDSTFCTKNAADPIANEGTSRDEYCGWSISASINMQHTQKHSSIDYPIAHHALSSKINASQYFVLRSLACWSVCSNTFQSCDSDAMSNLLCTATGTPRGVKQ